MARLELLKSKSLEQEIEERAQEIGMPMFDILESEEGEDWFTDMINELNEIRRKEDGTNLDE